MLRTAALAPQILNARQEKDLGAPDKPGWMGNTLFLRVLSVLGIKSAAQTRQSMSGERAGLNLPR